MISAICQGCGAILEADAETIGKPVACSACGHPQTLLPSDVREYWAFISYSSRDRKLGEWLHKRLETYPVPRQLRGIHLDESFVIGKYLKPVFRDRDELPASDNLGQKILEALIGSKYLIVICSPHSAKSKWVEKEILDFQALGKGGQILAIIASGEPNSGDPATECFPPPLRLPHEPIAADIRNCGDGKANGFLKIIAGITQMGFDMVYKRDRKRRIARTIYWSLAGAAVAAALLIATHYAIGAKSEADAASALAKLEGKKSAEQFRIAEEERELRQAKEKEAEEQRKAKLEQEEIARTKSEEAERLDELNKKQFTEARFAQAKYSWLAKAQKATEDGRFPQNVLYAAVPLGFRGYGYEELSDSDKAVFDQKFPQLFDPTQHPELHRDLLRVLRGATRPLLPVWSASHDDAVSTIAYSPDGSLLASGGKDTTVKLWDPKTGDAVADLVGHEKEVLSLAFSPDQKTLASGSWDTSLRLWDLPSKSLRYKLDGHGRGVGALVWTPDSRTLISGSWDSTIRFWGEQKGQVAGHHSTTYALALSPRGDLLVSGESQYPLRVWDAATGKPVADLQGEHGSPTVLSLAIHPVSGTLASADEKGNIKLWNLNSLTQAGALYGHTSAVRSIVFSPDGSALASGGDDQNIYLWDVQKRAMTATLSGHSAPVTGLAFSPCGHALASGSKDKTVKLWDIAPTEEEFVLRGFDHTMTTVTFSPDGAMLAAGGYSDVGFWNAEDGTIIDPPPVGLPRDAAPEIAFSPNGNLIATDGKLHRWIHPRADGVNRPSTDISDHDAAFSPDGKFFASVRSISNPARNPAELGREPAPGTLRTYQIHLWDTTTQEEIRSWTAHSDQVNAISFTADSKSLVSTGNDRTIQWWSIPDGTQMHAISTPSWTGCLKIHPVTGLMATGGGDTKIHLWNPEEKKEISVYEAGGEAIESISFSPDGKILAAGDRAGTITFWEIESGLELRTLSGHSGSVEDLAFNPDGTLIASAGADRTVRMWKADPGPLDLAGYITREWYYLDSNQLVFAPAEPAAGGPLNMQGRSKHMRSTPTPPPPVAAAVTAPSRTAPTRDPKGPEEIRQKSRIELRVHPKYASKSSESFLGFRASVRNGELDPFSGSLTVVLVGTHPFADGVMSLISKEELGLVIRPSATQTVNTEETDTVDISGRVGGRYLGYVCAVCNAEGKLVAVSGSTSELEDLAHRLIPLEAREILRPEESDDPFSR